MVYCFSREFLSLQLKHLDFKKKISSSLGNLKIQTLAKLPNSSPTIKKKNSNINYLIKKSFKNF